QASHRLSSDAPARGERFQVLRGCGRVEAVTQMADFGGSVAVPLIDPAAHDEPTTDPGSDGDIEYGIAPLPCPGGRFRQRGHVAVVAHGRRQSELPTAPVA